MMTGIADELAQRDGIVLQTHADDQCDKLADRRRYNQMQCALSAKVHVRRYKGSCAATMRHRTKLLWTLVNFCCESFSSKRSCHTVTNSSDGRHDLKLIDDDMVAA